jgi:hypothetical protein
MMIDNHTSDSDNSIGFVVLVRDIIKKGVRTYLARA